MNMIQSVQTCLRKYANFSGRASRSEFWWFMLFTVILFVVFEMVDIKVFSFFPEGEYRETFSTTLLMTLGLSNGLFGTISGVALLIPTLAVTSRRLHDINMSGWWQGFTYLVFFIDAPFAHLPEEHPLFLMSITVMAIVYLGFVILWAKRGTLGMNRYGPPTDHEDRMATFD